ncbi:MAG: DUF2062 domain-containing protein [Acidobacteriota bacterium]
MKGERKTGVREFLRRLIHLGDSPNRTALAFAVGVFLGFSPLIGLHTVLGVIFAFAFRLNRLAVLVGVYVNSPWTVAPAASLGTGLGFLVLGTEGGLRDIANGSLFSFEFWGRLFSDVEHLLLPFVVGNLVLALVAGLAGYVIVRNVLIHYRARKVSHSGLRK